MVSEEDGGGSVKPLHMRIVEDFKVGHEFTTGTIKNIYAASDNYAQRAIDFLRRSYAVKNTGKKDGYFSIYVIEKDAYEKVMKKEQDSKRYRSKTNRFIRCDVKELSKTHNPLVLKFDALLAGVRA